MIILYLLLFTTSPPLASSVPGLAIAADPPDPPDPPPPPAPLELLELVLVEVWLLSSPQPTKTKADAIVMRSKILNSLPKRFFIQASKKLNVHNKWFFRFSASKIDTPSVGDVRCGNVMVCDFGCATDSSGAGRQPVEWSTRAPESQGGRARNTWVFGVMSTDDFGWE